MKNFLVLYLCSVLAALNVFSTQRPIAVEIALPKPAHKGTTTLEEALSARRTHRSFVARGLTLKQFSQILWAAYGITAREHGYNLKSAPSAGALYPLEIYGVVGEEGVETLAPGVYHFRSENHTVRLIKQGDLRGQLARNSQHQMWMAEAPLMLVIAAEYKRSSVKYGNRGVTYTHIEAGHVGQNIFLQAEAIGLKAGIVGSFDNREIIKSMGLPASHDPLLIMPLGYIS